MIRGLVSRRSSQRIPFQVEIGIQFAVDGQEAIIANTTNLSAEGVRFFLPKGTIKLAPDETIELVFSLPKHKEITIEGEICYFSNAVDGDLKPVIYYGVKFLNVSPEDSDAIQAFCDAQLSADSETETETETGTEIETAKDPEIETETETETETGTKAEADAEAETETEIKMDTKSQTDVTLEKEADTIFVPEPVEPETDNTAGITEQPFSAAPSFNNNENAFHSLSQEIIDQIVQSMQPTAHSEASPKEADPVPSQVSPVAPEPAKNLEEPVKVAEEPAPGPAIPDLSQNEAVLEKIRQLAESLNLKFDESMLKTSQPSSSLNTVSIEHGVALPDHTAKDPSNQSVKVNDLSFLEQPIGQNDTLEKEQATPERTELSSSLFKSQSSLIDVLYGGEQSEPASQKPETHSPIKTSENVPKSVEKTVEKITEPVKTTPLTEKPVSPAPTMSVPIEPKSIAAPIPPGLKPEPTASQPAKPATPAASIEPARPATSAPQAVDKPAALEKKEPVPSPAINRSSSVSMDQRLIDQIVESMTRKK